MLRKLSFYIVLVLLAAIVIEAIILPSVLGNNTITNVAMQLCTTLALAYFGYFLKEDYLRFFEGSAVASAICGELAAHAEALPTILKMAKEQLDAAKSGRTMKFRPMPTDTSLDPVFDAYVDKLGFLEPQLATDIAYVYELMRANRYGWNILATATDLTQEEIVARLTLRLNFYELASSRSADLLSRLNARAKQSFRVFS